MYWDNKKLNTDCFEYFVFLLTNKVNITDTNFNFLKENYSNYLKELASIGNDFGGPSIYFHNRALEEKSKNFLADTHLENIYATLVSWGMHRMGETSTKMVNYGIFKKSILDQKENILKLKDFKAENIAERKNEIIQELRQICFSFKVSISNSKIVGNSKALAHILPDLIPPIDRQYTIRFFTNEPKNSVNQKGLFKTLSDFKDLNEEEKCFTHILNKTFDFVNLIKSDTNITIDSRFNTSYPKIFDNFIMTYVKAEKNGV